MQALQKVIRNVVIVVLILGLLYFVVQNYSFVFSTTYEGQAMAVERVTQITAVIQTQVGADTQYSYAVKIRTLDQSGAQAVVTASSTDRQFSVVKPGECIRATLYPYPPWNLEKGGTYHNARLDQVVSCPKGMPRFDAPVGAGPDWQPPADPAAQQSPEGSMVAPPASK